MLTRRENLLIRPWQERRYINHRNKVESALPAIDVGTPAPRRHVVCKLKKVQKEAERCHRIHQDNFTLLQHLSAIMKTNRLDNYWVEAPPNFLHRVGIYHVKKPKKAQQLADIDFDSLLSRKDRCLGCNPRLVTSKIKIPEERIPWEPPKKRVSRKSRSFEETDAVEMKTNPKKASNESLVKLNTTPKSSSCSSKDSASRFPHLESHSVILKHGALRLAVNFPPQTTVKLRAGQSERLLMSEYCTCSRNQSTSTPVTTGTET